MNGSFHCFDADISFHGRSLSFMNTGNFPWMNFYPVVYRRV
uniref:Uncharacterized protein n=1 Tax=Lepeophtheirus salmonis TaxID=72036 RepID=A0A0K2TGV9_LEPSM